MVEKYVDRVIQKWSKFEKLGIFGPQLAVAVTVAVKERVHSCLYTLQLCNCALCKHILLKTICAVGRLQIRTCWLTNPNCLSAKSAFFIPRCKN